MTATTLNPKSPDGLLISRFIDSAVTDLSQMYVDSYKEKKGMFVHIPRLCSLGTCE